jgi:hypothetical protein
MSIPTLTTIGGQTREIGYAGQLVGNGHQIDAKVNENATAIDLARAVARGASDNTVKPFTAYADDIVGISGRAISGTVATTDGNNTVTYAQYADVPVVKTGRMCATAAENVSDGDDVIAITTGSGTLGGTTGGVANGTTRKTIKGAKWRTTTTSGSVGEIELCGVGIINLTT